MGWVVNALLWPFYPQKWTPLPTVEEVGWVPGPVWMGVEKGKSIALTWFRTPTTRPLQLNRTNTIWRSVCPVNIEEAYAYYGLYSHEKISISDLTVFIYLLTYSQLHWICRTEQKGKQRTIHTMCHGAVWSYLKWVHIPISSQQSRKISTMHS